MCGKCVENARWARVDVRLQRSFHPQSRAAGLIVGVIRQERQKEEGDRRLHENVTQATSTPTTAVDVCARKIVYRKMICRQSWVLQAKKPRLSQSPRRVSKMPQGTMMRDQKDVKSAHLAF